MKIGGRVIQEKRIILNTEIAFKATYKNRLIAVSLVKRGPVNTFEVFVRKRYIHKKQVELDEECKRVTLRDAIIYALDKSGL